VTRPFWRVLLAFAALTLVLTYPLSIDPGGRVLAVAADTDLFIWTLAWDAHALLAQPLSLFDANIYYPQSRTLAYSENLIGASMFSAPVWWATGNGVLAMNVAALASCALCGAGAWLLARRAGLSMSAAFLAGVVFAFAPPRFLRLPQLHLTMIQWVPFALAFLHSYLDGGRRRDLRLAALFFSLQALSSGHGAVFAAVAGAALIAYRITLGEHVDIARRVRDLGVAGVVLLLPSLLVTLPYLSVQREMQLRRSLADASTWTVSAVSFLASPTHVHEFILSQVTDRRINDEAWAYLFPGYLPLILAAAALLPTSRPSPSVRALHGSVWSRLALALEVISVAALAALVYVMAVGPIRWRIGDWTILSVRDTTRVAVLLAVGIAGRAALIRRAPFGFRGRFVHWRDQTRAWRDVRRRDARLFYALLAVLTVWLSASPPIGLWPAVYWLPGFNFIRVASRFTLLGVLCLAVLAAFGFDRLAAGLTVRRRMVAASVVCALLVAEFADIPLATTSYGVPAAAADVWLDRQAKPFSVVEVPVPTAHEGGEERRQTAYMLHSMAHWQKTVHGYSGLRPALHYELFRQLRLFPDETTLARLSALGVDYVVVHIDLYPPGEWPVVEGRLQQFDKVLKLVYSDETARIYAIS
jgi:hypothetical protein